MEQQQRAKHKTWSHSTDAMQSCHVKHAHTESRQDVRNTMNTMMNHAMSDKSRATTQQQTTTQELNTELLTGVSRDVVDAVGGGVQDAHITHTGSLYVSVISTSDNTASFSFVCCANS